MHASMHVWQALSFQFEYVLNICTRPVDGSTVCFWYKTQGSLVVQFYPEALKAVLCQGKTQHLHVCVIRTADVT